MCKKGEKNTHYVLGKGDKEKHKEKAAEKNKELKKNRNILKVNATALKDTDFSGSYMLLVFYTKTAIQTSPSYSH